MHSEDQPTDLDTDPDPEPDLDDDPDGSPPDAPPGADGVGAPPAGPQDFPELPGIPVSTPWTDDGPVAEPDPDYPSDALTLDTACGPATTPAPRSQAAAKGARRRRVPGGDRSSLRLLAARR